MVTEIAKSGVEMFHLLQVDFSTTVYHTDYFRDLTWDSKTWSPGDLVSVSSVKENIQVRNDSIQVTLSGVNQDNISTALTEDFINNRVYYYRGFILNSTIVVDPVLLFDGRIDSFNINEDPKGTSRLTWTVASHWSDFERKAGRRTNDTDQQSIHSGDLGMEFSSEILKDIVWGGPTPVSTNYSGRRRYLK